MIIIQCDICKREITKPFSYLSLYADEAENCKLFFVEDAVDVDMHICIDCIESLMEEIVRIRKGPQNEP